MQCAGQSGAVFITNGAALDFQVSLSVSIVFKMAYVQLFKKNYKIQMPVLFIQTKQGSRPSCRDQKGRRASEEVVPENLSVPLEGDR